MAMDRTSAFLIGGCAGGSVVAAIAIWPTWGGLGLIVYMLLFVSFACYDMHLIKKGNN